LPLFRQSQLLRGGGIRQLTDFKAQTYLPCKFHHSNGTQIILTHPRQTLGSGCIHQSASLAARRRLAIGSSRPFSRQRREVRGGVGGGALYVMEKNVGKCSALVPASQSEFSPQQPSTVYTVKSY
jgi:hypothetical protein